MRWPAICGVHDYPVAAGRSAGRAATTREPFVAKTESYGHRAGHLEQACASGTRAPSPTRSCRRRPCRSFTRRLHRCESAPLPRRAVVHLVNRRHTARPWIKAIHGGGASDAMVMSPVRGGPGRAETRNVDTYVSSTDHRCRHPRDARCACGPGRSGKLLAVVSRPSARPLGHWTEALELRRGSWLGEYSRTLISRTCMGPAGI